MVAGPRFRGWKYDANADRLGVQFGVTEVFDFDANDIAFKQATSFVGTMKGVRMQVLITSADTDSLVAAESGMLIICTKASSTQVFTLPVATTVGATFTFKCANAGGEILINPAGSDDIQCSANSGASPNANVVNTDGTGLKNTGATNVLGDSLMLVADGVGKWYAVSQTGIWASQ